MRREPDRRGSIFVAELKDNPYSNRIAKYDLNGVFQYEIRPTGSSLPYSVWITVDDATAASGC